MGRSGALRACIGGAKLMECLRRPLSSVSLRGGFLRCVSLSDLRHSFLNDFAANFEEADAVAFATACLVSRLRCYELDESSDDAIELVVQARVLLNVATHDRDFQTRKCFASRAQRAVVARRPILSAAIHAFCKIERHGATTAPELAGQIAIAKLNPPQRWLELFQDFQDDVINAEHVAFLLTR
jgi:hypothetical protein